MWCFGKTRMKLYYGVKYTLNEWVKIDYYNESGLDIDVKYNLKLCIFVKKMF